MYYVSRIDSASHVYITDTEDGVEEYLTRDQIKKLISAGVKIQGVTWTQSRSGELNIFCNVSLPPSIDRARLMLSQGIDIGVTADGEAVSLKIVDPDNSDGKSWRLSDYCKRVGPNMVSNGIYNATLIFDDKLESVDKKWCYTYADCKVDVSDVTRDDLLINIIYPLGSFGRTNIVDNGNGDRLLKYGQLSDLLHNKELDTRGGFVLYDSFIISHCKKMFLKGLPKVDVLPAWTPNQNFKHEWGIYVEVLRRLYNSKSCDGIQFWYHYLYGACKRAGVRKAATAMTYVGYGGADKDVRKAVSKAAILVAESGGLYKDGRWLHV